MKKSKLNYAGTQISLEQAVATLSSREWAVTGGQAAKQFLHGKHDHIDIWSAERMPAGALHLDICDGHIGHPNFFANLVEQVRQVSASEIRVYGPFEFKYQKSKADGGGEYTDAALAMVLKLEHMPTVEAAKKNRRLEREESKQREKAERIRAEAKRVKDKARFEDMLNKIFAGKNIKFLFPEQGDVFSNLMITNGDTGEMVTIGQKRLDDGCCGGFSHTTINHIPIDRFVKPSYLSDDEEGDNSTDEIEE